MKQLTYVNEELKFGCAVKAVILAINHNFVIW